MTINNCGLKLKKAEWRKKYIEPMGKTILKEADHEESSHRKKIKMIYSES